jgi:hypothetical protein
MTKERANIKQVRRNRWERQRRAAIKQEQIERSYKQYTPPQVATLDWRNKSGQEPNGLFTAHNETHVCGRIRAIGSPCVYCAKHGGDPS